MEKQKGRLNTMTFKEFAHKQATLLIEKPTQQNVIQVVSTILNCKVDGQPITSSQISQILRYLEDEIGDLRIILESFDNTATLSLMGEVRKLIAQAQETKKQ